MKKLISSIVFLLMLSSISNFSFAQSIPAKQAEQARRSGKKSEHITNYYSGKIVRLLYSPGFAGGYLNGIVFRKSNGKLIKLWISGHEGINVKPYLTLNKEVEVKASGDPVLLKELLFKDTFTKKLEKELKGKIAGLGYLKEIITPAGAYKIKETPSSSKNKPLLDSKYETRLGISIKEVIKLKNRRALIVLENGDSLESYSISAAKKSFRNNQVSYLRPYRAIVAGYSYKTNNTFRISAGNLIMAGNTIARVPTLNHQGVFIDQKIAKFSSLLPGQRGLVNQLNATTKDGIETFKFSSKNARELQSFLSDKKEEALVLYYKPLTPNGHAKSKKDNMLYAICSSKDTLYTDDYYSFINVNNHYSSNISSYEGVITKIHYPKKVNKTSIIRIPQTVATGFRSLLIDDNVYLQIRDVLALSIAELVKEGGRVSFEGWIRKDLPEEINELGYTIMIPSKITIDGKSFSNEVNLKTAL